MQAAANNANLRVWHPILFAAWPVLSFLTRDAVPGDAAYVVSRVLVVACAAVTYFLLRQVLRDGDKAGVILSVVIIALLSYSTVHEVACRINEVTSIEFLRGEYSAVRHRYVLGASVAVSLCLAGYFLLTRRQLTAVTGMMNILAVALISLAIARVAIAKWTRLPFGIEERVAWTTSNVKGSPPRIDEKTERTIIQWPCDGHHGGCLKFGPDDYLYIATGDASGIADEDLTGQDLGKLPGSILRIDVNQGEYSSAYGIPEDNPFVDVEGARSEIWAYGLREPWKINFDRATGELWGCNVGQDLWETVLLIQRGGNYGWSVTEGSHPFRPERQRGPTPILPPVVEHHHSEARSLTGGYVYRGSRLHELQGDYIYGDYDIGKVWSLRYDGKKVTEHKVLVDSSLRIVGFAETNDGELYLLDHVRGTIHQLAENPALGTKVQFPRKLSETGLFASVKSHVPAPGLIPYSINAPAWSDGASKERFIGLPGESRIEFDALVYPHAAAPRGWKFPDETVVAETISLEMEKGNPASRRRLETRILHHERLAGSTEVGDQRWRGYTYVWNDEQTEAVLLEDPQGMDRTFTIKDPDSVGGLRQQTWHFPSHAECVSCHNMAAKYVIAVNTLQMNKDHDYGGVVDNQLRALEHVGVFAKRLPASPTELPRLASYSDETQDVNQRARAYLHANCAHCHRNWGGGNTDFQLLATLTLDETLAAEGRPRQGTFLIPDARVVARGDPYRSVLAYRMATLGSGRMPRIGSGVVDEAGLALVHKWIEQLPAEGGDPASLTSRAPTRDVDNTALNSLRSDNLSDEQRGESIDQLLASTSGALQLMHAVGQGWLPEPIRRAAITRATRHPEPHVQSLFERFVPEQRRRKRLGTAIDSEEILALSGDKDRGERVFFQTAGITCKSCHRINGIGSEFGPDLSQIGKKYSRAQILESIVQPSKHIDPKYQSYLVMTADGRVFTGLMVRRDSVEVELKDAANKTVRIANADVEVIKPRTESLMPALLLREMTAQQVADLTAYLSELGRGN
jgi:uncharacterized repeat protein (TIGR03806 family)